MTRVAQCQEGEGSGRLRLIAYALVRLSAEWMLSYGGVEKNRVGVWVSSPLYCLQIVCFRNRCQLVVLRGISVSIMWERG